MSDGVNQTELGESFGVSRRTIATWDREGLADAARTSDRPVTYDLTRAWRWRFDNKPPESGPSDKKELALRELAAKVKVAELEAAQMEGELIPLGVLDETLTDVFGRLRAKIIAFKGALAPRLTGLDTPREVKGVLDVAFDELIDEMRQVTDELGEDGIGDEAA